MAHAESDVELKKLNKLRPLDPHVPCWVIKVTTPWGVSDDTMCDGCAQNFIAIASGGPDDPIMIRGDDDYENQEGFEARPWSPEIGTLCGTCDIGGELTIWTGKQWISSALGLEVTRDPGDRPAVRLSSFPYPQGMVNRLWAGNSKFPEDVDEFPEDIDDLWVVQRD